MVGVASGETISNEKVVCFFLTGLFCFELRFSFLRVCKQNVWGGLNEWGWE